ncbi:keratin, type II cytoskeletal 7-like [Dryobates pubescens]|uniref:keratin, type II cytoskeletal 7-like n=1 Tax=Dryobates pubescens TaxID=118200 RepID=UPI0023B90E41|nr:keratin, type II cytoskeletal 7-like [Dryobates pubescens]
MEEALEVAAALGGKAQSQEEEEEEAQAMEAPFVVVVEEEAKAMEEALEVAAALVGKAQSQEEEEEVEEAQGMEAPASMSQQLAAGRSCQGRRCFSSSSAASGLSRRRGSAFPAAAPLARGCGAWSRSCQSLRGTDGWGRDPPGLWGGWGCRGTPGSRGGGRQGSGRSGSGGLGAAQAKENLLKPPGGKAEPQPQQLQQQEGEQMESLNKQFASLIDKVQHLEQQNRRLVTKWALLQKQLLPCQRHSKEAFGSFICSLQGQLELLLHEKGQMEPELSQGQKAAEEFRCKYQQEESRRAAAEKEFELLGKDADSLYLAKLELEAKVKSLKEEMEFLKGLSAQGMTELERSPSDTSVVVRMDNSRALDVESILRSIQGCCEDVAQKTKAELEALYRPRFQELEEAKGRGCDELKSHQKEMEELRSVVHSRQHDLEDVKQEVASLQTSLWQLEQRGACALQDAQEKQLGLQGALQKAREELAAMLGDCQQLLGRRLALGIEIAAYKTLLEGEERRVCLRSLLSACE